MLLAAEIVLSAVFLAVTILATRSINVKVFKSSSFATLMVMNEESRSITRTLATVSEEDRVLVQLCNDRLVWAGNKPVRSWAEHKQIYSGI